MSYEKKHISITMLLITSIFISAPANSKSFICGCSKKEATRIVLSEVFTNEETSLIIKQHKKITPKIATDIINHISKETLTRMPPPEKLSLFCLHASVLTGFNWDLAFRITLYTSPKFRRVIFVATDTTNKIDIQSHQLQILLPTLL